MTDKPIDPADIPLDTAKEIVARDQAASKDGVASDHTDPSSGIIMKAQEPDKSVATYDPANVEREKDKKPEKSKYQSGEPVHDRS